MTTNRLRFLAIDLGASETRYCVDGGAIFSNDNYLWEIDENEYVALKPRTDEIEDALDVSIYKEGVSDYFPCRVLMGNLADRFGTTQTRPSGAVRKLKQKVNHVSIMVTAGLAAIKRGIPAGSTVEVPLYLALPPVQIGEQSDKEIEELKGVYTVKFNKKNMAYRIVITAVHLYAESYLAILSHFVDTNAQPIKENVNKYKEGNILSVDIGATTTDLVVVHDLQYLERTGFTYQSGSNQVIASIISGIQKKFSVSIDYTQGNTALCTGYLRVGNTMSDISDIVGVAKRNYARALAQRLATYFSEVGVEVSSVRAIVVSGGGSMATEAPDGKAMVQKVPAMSDYIVAAIREMGSGIDVEAYRGVPRLANINGLISMAKLDDYESSQA